MGRSPPPPRWRISRGSPPSPARELSDRLYSQAEALGAQIELEEVQSLQPGTPHTVTTDYGVYRAGAVTLATGMQHRSLGLPGEGPASPASPSAQWCDGAFYAGQDTAVAGGGNTAFQDALYLADICRHVTLLHRREEFRADPVLVEEARGRSNITLLPSTVVTALEGDRPPHRAGPEEHCHRRGLPPAGLRAL